jgi:iron complex outermembrane receptor protein
LVGNVLLRGSVYRTDVRDEILFIASRQALLSGYFTNLDRTRRTGGEVDAQGAFGERATWFASYTATRATFETPVQIATLRSDRTFAGSSLAGANDVAPGDELPLVPRSQLKLGGSLHLSRGLSAGLNARRLGRQWLRGDEANETKPLDAYGVLDARLGLARSEWDVSLVLRNALDSHAAVFGTFNENRRTGDLERFLTPLGARSFRFTIQRAIGP